MTTLVNVLGSAFLTVSILQPVFAQEKARTEVSGFVDVYYFVTMKPTSTWPLWR